MGSQFFNELTQVTQQIYPVKYDLPCGVWKLLHGEPISLGLNKPNLLIPSLGGWRYVYYFLSDVTA